MAPRSSAKRASVSGADWWIPVVAGVVTVGVGTVVLIKPSESIKVLAVISGIYLLLDSAIAFVAAIGRETEGRELAAVHGVFSLLVGLVLIRHPIKGVTAIALMIGLWLVVVGAIRLVAAFRAEHDRGWRIIVALVQLIAGIVIVSDPNIGFNTLALITGISLIVQGCTMIVLGWAGRSATPEERTTSPYETGPVTS